MVKNILCSLYRTFMTFNREAKLLSKFAALSCESAGAREALDVGCGYGRTMKVLVDRKFDLLLMSQVDIVLYMGRLNRAVSESGFAEQMERI